MRIEKTLALLALLLAPCAALAADLTFGLRGLAEYDDNAFRAKGRQEDDVLFRMRPSVRIHEDRAPDLRYSLEYAVPFEFAVDHGDELDDIDHQFLGNATYHVSNRLEFFASDDFRYLRSALRNVQVEDIVSGEGVLLVNQNRERTTLNEAEAGARYQFTPRLSGSARASHELFESDRRDRADNWLLSGTLDLSYVATPRHTVGLGVRYLRQQFDATTNIVSSVTNSYNAFAQWIFRYDETLSFSVSAGPTLLDINQDDADATSLQPAVPYIGVLAGEPTAGTGLLRPDGSLATAPLSGNGVIVSQLSACPTITATGTPVFTGAVCPIDNRSPTTAGVVLDRVVDGNALVDAIQALVPVTNPSPKGNDATRLNVFAEAVIAKHWSESLHSALRYERTQGGASGLGGTVIGDYVSLSNTWDITELWQLAIRGDWSLRQTVNEATSQYLVAGAPTNPTITSAFSGGVVPAGAVGLVTVRGSASEVDTMRYGAAGRLTRRFTRNTSGWVQLTYNEQTSRNDTLGTSSDFENFLAVIGVRHVFDPVKLW